MLTSNRRYNVSYKTILLYIDSPESASKLVSAAAKVAERSEGHLIGMYVTPPVPVYGAGGYTAPVSLDTYHIEYHEEQAEKARHTFEEITSNRAFVTEWRTVDAVTSVTQKIADQTREVDVLMLATDVTQEGSGLSEDHISKIISSTHRPVLILPIDQELESIGTRVLVGWDGGDESSRAVFDSLPMLKHADHVNILRINPTGDERHHTLGTSSEIVNTLARHDVEASLSFSACSISEIGDVLLRTAFENDADMLVMGAYGHNKLRDFLMGSVTRNVLQQMKVPILISC